MLDLAKIKPVNKNLIVKVIDTTQEKSAGGIVLVGSALKQEMVKHATVVAVDSELESSVKIGDRVLFQDNYANALTFKLDMNDSSSTHTILPFNLVLMVVSGG